jgi:hypothetical protein
VVLFWAIGVVPAGAITAIRGRWLLFFCGWLALGILWFPGALAPDPEGPPRDPRWILVPVAIAAVMVMLGIFGARPSPVLGLNGGALQHSVGSSLITGDDSCEPASDGTWGCSHYDVGSSSTVSYRVTADWKGCWHAVLRGRPTEDNPKRRSGCVSLVNYVF